MGVSVGMFTASAKKGILDTTQAGRCLAMVLRNLAGSGLGPVSCPDDSSASSPSFATFSGSCGFSWLDVFFVSVFAVLSSGFVPSAFKDSAPFPGSGTSTAFSFSPADSGFSVRVSVAADCSFAVVWLSAPVLSFFFSDSAFP